MPMTKQDEKLIKAITNNDLKQAYLAIKEGAKVNAFFYHHYVDPKTEASSDYLYPLHFAASKGDIQMVTLLLENGANRSNTITISSNDINELITAATIARHCGYDSVSQLIMGWTPRKPRLSNKMAAELQHESDFKPSYQQLLNQNQELTKKVAEQEIEIARLKAVLEKQTNGLFGSAKHHHLTATPSSLESEKLLVGIRPE